MVSGPYFKNNRRRWPWTGTGTFMIICIVGGLILAAVALITH
jgi:hypothetical protein